MNEKKYIMINYKKFYFDDISNYITNNNLIGIADVCKLAGIELTSNTIVDYWINGETTSLSINKNEAISIENGGKFDVSSGTTVS